MKVTVHIDCDTIHEFYSHLCQLKRQIKKEAKRLKLNPLDDEFTRKSGDKLYDDNCYGTHIVTVSTNYLIKGKK